VHDVHPVEILQQAEHHRPHPDREQDGPNRQPYLRADSHPLHLRDRHPATT
ncbi:unnamed protein product, partial [Musa textilis]